MKINLHTGFSDQGILGHIKYNWYVIQSLFILVVDHLSKNPSKSRILIVEDDKSIRETLREALVAEGFAVEVCKTGDEAQTRIFSQFDKTKSLI